jgi:hypothetical protein
MLHCDEDAVALTPKCFPFFREFNQFSTANVNIKACGFPHRQQEEALCTSGVRQLALEVLIELAASCQHATGFLLGVHNETASVSATRTLLQCNNMGSNTDLV